MLVAVTVPGTSVIHGDSVCKGRSRGMRIKCVLVLHVCGRRNLVVGFVPPSADSMAGSGLRGLVAGVVASWV